MTALFPEREGKVRSFSGVFQALLSSALNNPRGPGGAFWGGPFCSLLAAVPVQRVGRNQGSSALPLRSFAFPCVADRRTSRVASPPGSVPGRCDRVCGNQCVSVAWQSVAQVNHTPDFTRVCFCELLAWLVASGGVYPSDQWSPASVAPGTGAPMRL